MAEYFLKRRAKQVQIFKYYCDFAMKRSFEEWVPKLSLGIRKKWLPPTGQLDDVFRAGALRPSKVGTRSSPSFQFVNPRLRH
jgi:hypothetical protein